MKDEQVESSRIPVIPVVIFLVVQAIVLLTWAPLGRGDLNPYLSKLGVVPLQVPFGDFRTISAGIQFAEQGEDPYTDGRYDFMGRKFNYPPIWLKLSFLGLSPEGVSYVFFTFATLFALALLLLFWQETNRAWPLYFVFILSPPVVLALERCNNDLLMFFLVVFAVRLGRNSTNKVQNWVAGGLLLFATVLKVFPVFAFYMFVRKNWKKTLVFILPFGALCAAYYLSIKSTMDLIHENTPWGVYLSFGLNVIPSFLAEKWPDSAFLQGPMPLAVAWVIASLGLFVGLRLGKRAFVADELEGYDATLFRVGGAIYIAVFFMGSNYDYRLMFLLLTLPFSFRMIAQKSVQKTWFLCFLFFMFFGMWVNEAAAHYWSHGRLMESGMILNELCSWAVLVMLIISQFRMLPEFVRDVIYKPSEVS